MKKDNENNNIMTVNAKERITSKGLDGLEGLNEKDVNLLSEVSSEMYKSFKIIRLTLLTKISNRIEAEDYENTKEDFYTAIYDLLKCGVSVLYRNDIFEYTSNDLLEIFNERFSLVNELPTLYKAETNIVEFNQKMNNIREQQRNSRGYWQGGGFGIKGAIKGAMKASMLNAGSSIMHGVSDNISDFFDSRKQNKKMKEEYGNVDFYEEFSNALYKASDETKYIILEILEQKKIMNYYPYIDNKKQCFKIVNGIVNAFSSKDIDAGVLKKKLIEIINKYPYLIELYEMYFLLEGDENQDLLVLSQKYGLYDQYVEKINKVEQEKVNALIDESLNCSDKNRLIEIADELERFNNSLPERKYGELIKQIRKLPALIDEYDDILNSYFNKNLGVSIFKNTDYLWDCLDENIDADYESILLSIYTEGLERVNNSDYGFSKKLDVSIIENYFKECDEYKNRTVSKVIRAVLSSDKENYNCKRITSEELKVLTNENTPLSYYAKALWNDKNIEQYLKNLEQASKLKNIEANILYLNTILSDIIEKKEEVGWVDLIMSEDYGYDYLDICKTLYKYKEYESKNTLLRKGGLMNVVVNCYSKDFQDYIKDLNNLYDRFKLIYFYRSGYIDMSSDLYYTYKKRLNISCDYVTYSYKAVEDINDLSRRINQLKDKWNQVDLEYQEFFADENNRFFKQLENKLEILKFRALPNINQIKQAKTEDELKKIIERFETTSKEIQFNLENCNEYKDAVKTQKAKISELKHLNKIDDAKNNETVAKEKKIEPEEKKEDKVEKKKKRNPIIRAISILWKITILIISISLLLSSVLGLLQGDLVALILMLSSVFLFKSRNLFDDFKNSFINLVIGIIVFVVFGALC